MQLNAVAQAKNGIENYNFLSSKEAYVWMPVIHHVSKKGVYTELRYNYEELKTASFYLGKTFTKDSKLSYTITPMMGIIAGKFNGGAPAINIDMEYKKTFFSMQTQYAISSDDKSNNFFFNWTEVAYQPVKWFYTGVSMQQTKIYKSAGESEYGILAAFVIKKITIPVYIFNPLNENRNFIVGINTEW